MVGYVAFPVYPLVSTNRFFNKAFTTLNPNDKHEAEPTLAGLYPDLGQAQAVALGNSYPAAFAHDLAGAVVRPLRLYAV